MSPILPKLSGRRISPAEIADILERHIGEGANTGRCQEACDALHRVRRHLPNFYIRAAFRALDRNDEPCVCVRKVIAALRKWRYVSGA